MPDNHRKVHKNPIPRVGGVALAAAYFGSLLVTATFAAYQQAALSAGLAAIKSIAPAALAIFAIGLADDIFNLKPWHKFAIQIVAAGMVVFAGVQIHSIGSVVVHPAVGAAATILWLVVCTNAVNLIDGLDGLAAGIAFLATATAFIASLMSGNIGLTMATGPLLGALLGFLVFNFNPASIFLGDSGSLLLGFLLGCFGVLWGDTSITLTDMAAPLMALAVPLSDTTLAIGRRFLRKQPIFKADRSHIHHRLLARGLSHRRTVLLLYLAAGLAGSLSLCLICARNRWDLVVLAAFACAVAFGIRKLGYAEFEVFGQVILGGSLRKEINVQLALRTFGEGLEAAATVDDCWNVIQDGCEEFGFRAIRMELAGRNFGDQHDDDLLRAWAMRIPISKGDWIELSQTDGPAGYRSTIVPFANTMRLVLADKPIRRVEAGEKIAVASAPLFRAAASSAS